MNLKILLPFKIFSVKSDVSSIIAETKQGSIGLLPHRRDFVAAISPGILRYEISDEQKVIYVALDEGVLVKTGLNVVITVRNAIAGKDLHQLQEAVEKDFLHLTAEEKNAQDAVRKMESRFVSQIARFHSEVYYV